MDRDSNAEPHAGARPAGSSPDVVDTSRPGERRNPRRPVQQSWLRHALGLVGLLVVFYLLPVSGLAWSGRTAASVALTLLGVISLAWAITGQLRRQLTIGSQASLQSLVMLLELVAMVFALGYYVLDLASPGEVAGLHTRTDALYFTVSTLSTIGFGDVHAVGQLARSLVLIQMVFDLVFVAAVASTLSGRFRARMDR